MIERPTYKGMNVDEYARHYVKRQADMGFNLELIKYGCHGQYHGEDLRTQVGHGVLVRGTGEDVKVKSDELFVQIGDEWKVFSLPKLYEEVTSGAIQASLL